MIWFLALAPVIDGISSHTPQRAAEKSELVAQIVSDEIHQSCLVASDYSGCIRSNSGEPTSRANQFNETDQSSDQEKCWDNGVCIAKSGQDQLGMNKVVGWNYSYNPSDNTVLYWNLPAKRVPHRGQPDRYIAVNFIEHYYQQPIAAKPGYYREITPAKTECKPTYGGGMWVNGKWQQNRSGQTCTTSAPTKIWVAGTPGVQGGPRRRSWVRVTDCEDMTLASYINGQLRGNWSKATKNNQAFCNNRSDLEIVNMKL